MVRKRFEAAFDRLREHSNKMAETDRSPDNFDEIVSQRAEYDLLSDDAVRERKRIVSRYEPPVPDSPKEPRRPDVSTSKVGKIAAAIAVVVMVAGLIGIVVAVQGATKAFPLALEAVAETVDPNDGCRWTVLATIRNNSDETVTVERLRTVLNRKFAVSFPDDPSPMAPGASSTIEASWSLRTLDVCPSANDVSHGNLTIYLDNGATVAHSF